MAKRTASDAAYTRAEILEKAKKLFAEQGYAATSAREISAAAGVTVGAMFHHFDSKLDLFEEVFKELELAIDRQAKAESRPEKGLDVLETFLAGVRTSLDFAEQRDFHRIVFVEAPAVFGEEKWREVDSRLGLKTVMAGTRALMAAGFLVEQPVKPVAILLMGAMNAAGFALARGEEEVDKEMLVDALRLLIAGAEHRRKEDVDRSIENA
ncbi:MAG TPA: TetR family transcriptional regulator [Sphingorhabdus sp.]|nr:TetR family transcriptional regulator [Sphingorhabdus sp.]